MSQNKLDELIRDSDLKYDIIQNLKASDNFSFLNAGNDRVVAKRYDENRIYKIEENPHQNVREFNLYNNDNQKLRTKLLEVTGKGDDYRWIKCPLSNFNVTEEEKIRFINNLIIEYGLIPKDFSPKDIGRVNGDIVIIDYGYGFQEREDEICGLSDIVT